MCTVPQQSDDDLCENAAAKDVEGKIRKTSCLVRPQSSALLSVSSPPGCTPLHLCSPFRMHISPSLALQDALFSVSSPSAFILPPGAIHCHLLPPAFIPACSGLPTVSKPSLFQSHALLTLCACTWVQLLGEELGKGAHGKVYKGLDQETGMFVAVKEISLEKIAKGDLASITVSRSVIVQFHAYHCTASL